MRRIFALLSCVALVLAGAAMADSPEQLTASGKVIAVDAEKRQLTLESDGKGMVFEISEKTEISRDVKSADLTKVAAGELAIVTYESNESTLVAVRVAPQERRTV